VKVVVMVVASKVEGRWKLREPPTSREDSLVVEEGRWRAGNHPTSHRDSLVLVIVVGGDVAR